MMVITFDKEKMSIKHESGLVVDYSIPILEETKLHMEENLVDIQDQIAFLDEAISNINSSIGAN